MSQQRTRTPRRALHGVLLLDKPVGLSSNDALQRVRRLFNADKAGHTGTLDPLASGLLPLCFGAATKFAQASLEADKRYVATLKLGERTAGGDAEGEVIERRPVSTSAAELAAVLSAFVGAIDQMPPMHSALKRNGRALYEYAREGIEVERAPRRVTIRSLELLDFDGTSVRIDVRCTKGTYIRALADDIGQRLGCGAHLSALRRTETGALRLDAAVPLEAIEAMAMTERDALLHPPEILLAHWPAVALPAMEAERFLQGLCRRLPGEDCAALRVQGPHGLLGTGRLEAGLLHPIRLLSPAEAGALTETTTSPT